MKAYLPEWFKGLLKSVFTIALVVLLLVALVLFLISLLQQLPDLFGATKL